MVSDKLSEIIPKISPIPGVGAIDGAALLAAHQLPAVTSVRKHPLKITTVFDQLEQVPWCTAGRYLDQRPTFTLDPLFHAGAYYVQEASSMFIHHAFETLVERKEKSLRVLDLCAAPGGKSTLIASLLQQEDLLIANEVIQPRAAILAENLTRWGQMNTWVTHNDPKDFSGLTAYFDVLLIDAPCTGSGLWRKDIAALDEWSTDHVKLCAERQKRIIADVWPSLKPGGLLLYATCSYSTEENEMIVDWLCSNFSASSQKITIPPDWSIQETRSEKNGAYGYRFYPWKLKGEGFFMAALRKGEEDDLPTLKQRNAKNKTIVSPRRNNIKDEGSRWEHWLSTGYRAVERNGEYYAICPAHHADLTLLQSKLHINKTGTALGRVAGKDVVPDHELSLSIHLSPNVSAIALTKAEALSFLKKEEVRKDNDIKGWQVARYDGLALGWGKWLPNRMNNYLPKSWRIRMEIP